MIGAAFNAIFFTPLYNALVLVSLAMPGHDLGLSIIFLTLLVKFALAPFAHKSLTMQNHMRALEPKIQAIKDQHKENAEEQARKIMALYKEHGVNPFSSFLLLFIQIPIILALYWVFRSGLVAHRELLYPFVHAPDSVNTLFLGAFDIAQGSIALALVTGVTQFFQARLSIPPIPADQSTGDMKSDFARGMNLQMRYFLPVFVTLISFKLPAAIVLYWLTSNLFAIGHELFVRRRAKEAIAS